jgi:hypothetical protein
MAAEPAAGIPDRVDVDDGQPAVLVFIDIPASGGDLLDAGLPANRARRPGRRRPEEIFEGAGGIRPRDMERLRRIAKKLNPKGLRILRGPFPFAVDELVDDELAGKRDLRYVTFLREPIDRAISEYLEALDHLPPGTSFDEALEAGDIQTDLQTRMLSGSLEPFAEVTEQMLDEAKRNLRERFAFFGLAEHPEESLVLARMRLGTSTAIYRATGASAPRRSGRRADLRAGTRRSARRANRHDLELYRHANELFDSAPERQGLEFQCEVAAVRAIRGNDGVDVAAPVPTAFRGGEKEWKMLVRAHAEIVRLEWELADEEDPNG